MSEIRQAVTLEINGQKIFGILHLPEESKKQHPLVLMCHGFGGNKSGKFRMLVRQSEKLCRLGIASFRFDFRGAGDSEGEFADTTIQRLLQDAEAAFSFISSHTQVDKERIGILGRSLGGLISLLVAENHPTIRAIALQAPMFDAKPWMQEPKEKQKPFVHQGVTMGSDFMQQIAQLQTAKTHAKLLHIPLMHLQSTQDAIITEYHMLQHKMARNGAEAITEFVKLERSDHDFADPEEQEIVMTKTAAWFKKFL